MICFLSGLEIPKGRKSVDHFYPRSLLPDKLRATPENLFPAHKTINEIKSNLEPCVWEEKKRDRVYYAITHYNLKEQDINFCIRTLENWEEYKINPCQYCIMNGRCR